MALDGATPTMLGTSPLNRALGPSVFTMCLKKIEKNANWMNKEDKEYECGNCKFVHHYLN